MNNEIERENIEAIRIQYEQLAMAKRLHDLAAGLLSATHYELLFIDSKINHYLIGPDPLTGYDLFLFDKLENDPKLSYIFNAIYSIGKCISTENRWESFRYLNEKMRAVSRSILKSCDDILSKAHKDFREKMEHHFNGKQYAVSIPEHIVSVWDDKIFLDMRPLDPAIDLTKKPDYKLPE